MLFTKWGKEAVNGNPLPEYPRPQFVRDSFINLNGMWRLAILRERRPYYVAFPFRYNTYIRVPFSPECALSSVEKIVTPDYFLLYSRTFTLPEGFNKGLVFLHFGAVDQVAEVYINRQKIGTHTGGYTPFKFDITDFLVEGENEIIVEVRDETENNFYSRGKQRLDRGGIWYTPQSGIWQTVWLESTPREYIEDVRITPDYDNGQVEFKIYTEDKNGVQIKIYDGDKLIADTKDTVVKIPDFKSWSPENPFLYDVVFKTSKDEVKSYFGMRKFSIGVDKNGMQRIYLNNKPYFFNGLLDQGYYPEGLLTPPSYEAMLEDIKFVKSAGFNMLRKHIKVEPLMWYHYCDVNGIIVWQDMINGGGEYGKETSVIPFLGLKVDDHNYHAFRRESQQGRNFYYNEMRDIVATLYNSPCIALWTLFNEGWGQFDSKIAYEKMKNLDKTRIVDTTSGWHDFGSSDVISKHIYTKQIPFSPFRFKKGERPYILSEFGGYGLKIKDHTFNDKLFGYRIFSNSESLTKAYSKLYHDTIIPQIKQGLCACVYTQLTDVEDELNGLLTYDRKVQKIDINTIKAINERINRIKINDKSSN